jgi:predicted RNA-binding Zn-ribbon protein involved in translation (DUF1610 family)
MTRCSVCRSIIDEEDLFCANCGTEAPRTDRPAPGPAGTGRLAKDNFECKGCGASMSYDASAKGLRCPFCGSVDMIAEPDAKTLSPRRVVPFRVSREEAVAALRSWLGRGFFRPGGLAREASVVTMTPVYVPYWVFEARTYTYWSADSSQTPPGAFGDWYPMTGEHRGSYAGLLIGASSALTGRETQAICPFDLSAGVAPEDIDLDNVTVEQFSLPRKYARPLARQGLAHHEAEACAAYVPGRSRNVHVNVLLEGMSSEPVLLPVWVLAYRYRDRVFRFLANGQTGRATGTAPLSLGKVLAVVGIVALAVMAVLAILAGRAK